MTTFTVKVKERSTTQGSGFEATVSLQGAKPTKLTRKDGTTLFPTTSALKASARAFGNRFGGTVEYDEPAKRAAKTSFKTETSTPKTKATKTKKARKSATKSTTARKQPKSDL